MGAADKPCLAHGAVRAANSEIKKLLASATLLLTDQLDRLVSTLQDTDQLLVSLWFIALKLVSPQRKVTRLLLLAVTPEKKIIENVRCVLNSSQKFTIFTDRKGMAVFKPSPFGNVLIDMTAEGFKAILGKKIKLKRGVENRLEIVLEPTT